MAAASGGDLSCIAMYFTLNRQTLVQKQSGTLSLFSRASDGGEELNFARFGVCRGFVDDLNHLISIRLRIDLETEIANGRRQGDIRSGQLLFRWEFQAEK